LKVNQDLAEFFLAAQKYCYKNFMLEVELVEGRYFSKITADYFKREYVFVVLNSGMKNQVAEKIFRAYLAQGIVAVNHPGKHKAIDRCEIEGTDWFKQLQNLSDDKARLQYVGTLPFMGPIIRYHLARNIGVDCVKADRHLVRLAIKYGYTQEEKKIEELTKDVTRMCQDLSIDFGLRIGTIDVILWRYVAMGGQNKIC